MMALKSYTSGEAASCSAVGAVHVGGRNGSVSSSSAAAQPLLCRARVNPHHAGEAYIKDETVVILATLWMSEGGRPCERRTLSAYVEDAQVARRCCSIPRSELTVTPSTRMLLTREVPGMMSEGLIFNYGHF